MRPNWAPVFILFLGLASRGVFSAGQAAGARGASPVPDARHRESPYTAKFKITDAKNSVDGTIVTQETEQTVSVDSEGRTLIKTTPIKMTPVSASNVRSAATTFTVFDPVAGTTSSWDSQNGVATIMPSPPRQTRGPSCWVPVPAANGSASDGEPTPATPQPPPAPAGLSAIVNGRPVNETITFEDLGTETILGLPAHGIRITRTTPANENDSASRLVRTKETWRLNAHGVNLTAREVEDDPNAGKHSRELVNLTFGEPDPAEFQLPPEYRIATQEMHEVPCSGAP